MGLAVSGERQQLRYSLAARYRFWVLGQGVLSPVQQFFFVQVTNISLLDMVGALIFVLLIVSHLKEDDKRGYTYQV